VGCDRFARTAANSTAGVSLKQLIRELTEKIAAAASLGLLVPAFLLLSSQSNLTRPGPVFTREWRYGHKNRMIQVHKFRVPTVKSGRKQDTPEFIAVDQFLKRTGIEDLLMFINVITCEMSITGPAPSPHLAAVLNERAGTIRWAEIFGSGGL
jgi:polysaccharide biosynthesis protein PslA